MFFTKSNKRILAAVSLIAFALAAVVVFYGMPEKALADNGISSQASRRVLNVTGEGKVTAAPDIAYVNLGVTTEHKDAAAALSSNTSAMDKVISAIKAAGVAADDLQTTGYSIYPKYNYIRETGESEIVGYTVNNSVRVTIRDISKVGKILDTASRNGANNSGGISFGLSDYDKHYNEALKKAVQSAKKKAEVLSSAVGISIGMPVSVSEGGNYNPGRITIGYGMEKAMDSGLAQAPVPIEAGTFEVTANVSLVYEY
jgi:uncharacterized protein YggE